MINNQQIGVIIPAGGSGQRLGGKRKQLRLLDEKPLFWHSLIPFELLEFVDEIVLVIPEKTHSDFEPFLEGLKKVRIVEGGLTRQESVFNGINALSNTPSFVLIHDGVRPFISTEQILAVIEATYFFGAASLAIPVVDSLRRIEGTDLRETVPRENLVRMQTPQGFRLNTFLEAHQFAKSNKLSFTDDVGLYQSIGKSVQFVEGSTMNMKITSKSDWEFAEKFWYLWKEMQNDR